MYEGTYEGMKYGLIMAYDYNARIKYIFLDPISIKEVFPGEDYKSLVFEGNGDTLERIQDVTNECSLSKEQVLEQARDFMEEKIGIGEIDNNISETGDYYHADFGPSLYAYVDDNSMTRLAFSNTDYFTTMTSLKAQYCRGITRLASQDDQLADRMEKYDSDYFDTLYGNSVTGKNETELTRN